MKTILSVKDLTVALKKSKNNKILDNVSFEVEEGKTLGILGESGSGKSMTVKSILGLLDNSFDIKGTAIFDGKNLLQDSKENLRSMRGSEIAMVLQNPMTCFDPIYRIGKQLEETFKSHFDYTDAEIREKSIAILENMKIQNPEEVLKKYPHQLSGGMLQRIMIGLAMEVKPRLLIADEPTTAIDAITQFSIMQEFKKIKEENKTSMIFISHDLGAISYIADDILVLNKGKVSDSGSFKEILENAKDPYTQLLISQRSMIMKKYRKAINGGIA